MITHLLRKFQVHLCFEILRNPVDIFLTFAYYINMAHFDELFKHLAGYAPDQLAALALNTPHVEVGPPLNTEQATVKVHHSDLTFHIRLPDKSEDAILHIEAQTDESREKPMPLRMLAYASFLVHQHEKPVYSTVFYLRPPAGQTDPGTYEYGDETTGGLRFKYNVMRVYALEGESFLNPEALGLLPFTPLMRPPVDMTAEAWVEICIETTKSVPVDKATRGTLLYALSVFGGLVHPPELFQNPTLEALMQESPVYERIIQRGIEQGIEQGTRATAIKNILSVLKTRFPGREDPSVQQTLEVIDDLDRLDALHLTALKIATFEDFLQTLKA